MNKIIPIAVDLTAILLLSYGIYFRRYYRRDLLLSYLALNVGVLAVTSVLITTEASVGAGLGLFGLLSIVRLRSDAVTQEEVAYYFVALVLGLLGGVHPGPVWVTPALSALLLTVMFVGDHPALFTHTRRHTMTLDAAYTDERVLRQVLARLLDGEVRHLVVVEVDLVRDTTVVDVRYRAARRVPAPTGGSASFGGSAGAAGAASYAGSAGSAGSASYAGSAGAAGAASYAGSAGSASYAGSAGGASSGLVASDTPAPRPWPSQLGAGQAGSGQVGL